VIIEERDVSVRLKARVVLQAEGPFRSSSIVRICAPSLLYDGPPNFHTTFPVVFETRITELAWLKAMRTSPFAFTSIELQWYTSAGFASVPAPEGKTDSITGSR